MGNPSNSQHVATNRIFRLILCCAVLVGCKPFATVFVDTPVGTIGGFEEKGSQAFLGIPYAMPPIGDLRWREAQPNPPFENVFTATQAGTRCIQFAKGTETLSASEVFLFLNNWRPSGASTPTPESKLPVQATTGIPNGEGLPYWPIYDDQTRQYLELSAAPEVKSDLKAEKCALLNSLPLIHI